LQSLSTDEGIQIDESDEQHQNTYSSIHESLEFDSNISVERERQLEKQDLQSLSTDEGIQIDKSDEQPEQADSSIHESLEFDSNITVEREIQ
jgi:hypothetical protein